jgi:hypothetical protein
MKMFHDKPHLNIASQLLAGIVLFVAFQTYLANLKTQHHLQYNAIAIERMQLRHYQKLLAEKKKSLNKESKPSLDQP